MAALAVLLWATGPAGSAAAQDRAAPPPAIPAIPDITFTDNETRDNQLREFTYTWPAALAAVPPVTRRLIADRTRLLADQKADFDAVLRQAQTEGEGCFSCSRAIDKNWIIIADLPRFLVLSGSLYIYSGGAHGNTEIETLMWDRKAKKAFNPKRMFRSAAALQAALGQAWCSALREERIARMGREYGDHPAFSCPPIADLEVQPGSSDAVQFDTIGLVAAPYVAGAYADGTFEVSLPVTPAVLAAVKPAYAAAFRIAK